MKLRYSLLIFLALMALVSCKKWLDVKPKTQIEEDVLYQREAGFKDVLYGAYVSMASSSMYGREMTFGLVDVIGQVYPNTNPSAVYGRAKSYTYTDVNVEGLIGGIWQGSYNTIANLNSLIEHLRKADKTMFAADNYNVILGEALGLRALLHFDLLRLFAPSYKADAAATAIPFVAVYGAAITPESTVAVVLNKISADLEEASSLLKVSDPIITNRLITAAVDDGYLLQRKFHLNYYAVKAIMARVYLYMADHENAAKCADEVIVSGKFNWIKVDNIATDDARRDRTFSTEQIFVLNVPRMSEYIVDRLQFSAFGTVSGLGLYYRPADIDKLYPEANDWRKLYLWSAGRSGVSDERFSTKLAQPAGMPDSLGERMPVIRLPEMYLISAEAALNTDPSKTISRLRELRIHRGLDAGIPDNTPVATLSAEILKEYRREFVTEGILFYYYKRLDAATVEGVSGAFKKENYVLPKPAVETEYR